MIKSWQMQIGGGKKGLWNSPWFSSMIKEKPPKAHDGG